MDGDIYIIEYSSKPNKKGFSRTTYDRHVEEHGKGPMTYSWADKWASEYKPAKTVHAIYRATPLERTN